MHTHPNTSSALPRTSAAQPGYVDGFTGFLHRLARARALRAERLALARLDDRLLDDIGVSRRQAMTEASRLPWPAADTRFR